jgi:glycosyltransferase involved in cell wall biosynthesis
MQEFADNLKMDMKHHVWLPNPVNEDKIRTIPPKPRTTPGLQFISGGRLHAQKGYDRLILALKGFNPGMPWTLTILGEGPERHTLETLIRVCGLEQNIFLAGHEHNPWSYYAAADAFLLSSRWEGLPNVVLESLACGTPVIAMQEAGGIMDIASLAPQSVTTVTSISDMVLAMTQVSPAPTQVFRQSLLPDLFNKDNVQKRFTDIIQST